MKLSYRMLLSLMLAGQACARSYDEEPSSYFHYHFENKSDYGVDIRMYDEGKEHYIEYSDTNHYVTFKHTLEPNTTRTFTLEQRIFGPNFWHEYISQDMMTSLKCLHKQSFDSLRVYFNKSKSDERYVTYMRETFKPRDMRNTKEEYVFTTPNEYNIHYYYTFTNEDYNNTEKHQNTTIPTPACPLPRPCRVLICY